MTNDPTTDPTINQLLEATNLLIDAVGGLVVAVERLEAKIDWMAKEEVKPWPIYSPEPVEGTSP